MNLAFTYVITLGEAITVNLFVAMVVFVALFWAVYWIMKTVSEVRRRLFERKIDRIERKIRGKASK